MTVPGEFDFEDMLDEDFTIPNDPSNSNSNSNSDLDEDSEEDLIEDDFLDLVDESSINLSNEDLGGELKTIEEFDPIDELLL